MLIDVLVDPFGARWADVRATAEASEQAGFGGLWTWDHLAGRVHGAAHVLESWTVLSAVAAVTDRLTLGPMVLNVANRDPGTLAVMAATLQEVSGGRLLLGLGAGGGSDTPYAEEQRALGRAVGPDPARRQAVARAIETLREVWTGATGSAGGFLRPAPPPPILVGGFGPRMADLAGRLGDGINIPAGPGLPDLVARARRAREDAGRSGGGFLVTAGAGYAEPWLDPRSEGRRRLEHAGVDRLVLHCEATAWRHLRRVRL